MGLTSHYQIPDPFKTQQILKDFAEYFSHGHATACSNLNPTVKLHEPNFMPKVPESKTQNVKKTKILPAIERNANKTSCKGKTKKQKEEQIKVQNVKPREIKEKEKEKETEKAFKNSFEALDTDKEDHTNDMLDKPLERTQDALLPSD